MQTFPACEKFNLTLFILNTSKQVLGKKRGLRWHLIRVCTVCQDKNKLHFIEISTGNRINYKIDNCIRKLYQIEDAWEKVSE